MFALALIASLFALAQDAGDTEAHPDDKLVATVPAKHVPIRAYEKPNGDTGYTSLPFAFSPSGERVAFLAQKKRRVYAFIGDEDLGYGDIGYGDDGNAPVFSGDGEHVFISLVRRNRNRTEKWVVYHNDEVAAREDWVGPLTVSHDGQTIAFWTQPDYRLDKENKVLLDRACLVIAHHKRKVYKQTTSKVYEWGNTYDAPRLTENDTRALGHSFWDIAGTVVSVGGRKDKVLFERKGYYLHAVWSPDAKHVAMVLRNYGGSRAAESPSGGQRADWSPFEVQIDGVPMDVKADAWAMPAWSANGEHLAFVFHRGERFGVGVGETLLKTGQDMILEALPDSSGTRVAWIAQVGGDVPPSSWLSRWSTNDIVGGKERLVFAEFTPGGDPEDNDYPAQGNLFDEIDQLTFSPEENHVAYTAREGERWFVVCGEQRLGPFDAVGKLRWIDETLLAIGTREDRAFWWRHMPIR